MHQHDAIGDRIHLFFAFVFCVCLIGPQSVSQIAIAPLLVFFVVRIYNTFPIWIHGFGQPVVLLGLALCMWMGVTLVWSRDRALGLEEISQLRGLALCGFVFPVIERRGVLIRALVLGFLLAMIGQIIDAFNGFSVPALQSYFWHEPNRISGWFDPAVGGAMFVAGLGLVLPAALFERGRTGIAAKIITILMTISILATGTRGAWIAMVLLIICTLVFGVCTKRVDLRRSVYALIIGVLVVGCVIVFAGERIKHRAGIARTEIRLALEGEYDTETGARIRMGQLALHATLDHPLRGVGAGGYRDWAIGEDPQNTRIHDHAHNTVLHLGATTGLPGIAIGAGLLIVLLRNGFCAAKRDMSCGLALGPVFAILGFALVSMTNTVLIDAQSAMLIGMLAALSPAYTPGDNVVRDERSD